LHARRYLVQLSACPRLSLVSGRIVGRAS
jgi:hypothetical protein